MKIAITISDIDNENEAKDIIRRIYGSSVSEDIGSDNDALIEEFFNNISWEVFAVMHAVHQYGRQDLSLDFDQLRQVFNVSHRAISSRVGGAQRISRRLKIPSPISIKERQNTKLVRLDPSYIQKLDECLDEWRGEYIKWMEDNELEQLKQDFCEWMRGE